MVKEVRQMFGIPQAAMADYLFVSRSMLSMIEMGERWLPGKESLHILEFYKVLVDDAGDPTANNEKIEELLVKEKARKRKVAERQLRNCSFKLYTANRKLEKLQQVHERSFKMLKKMDRIKAVAVPEDETVLELVRLVNERLFRNSGEDIQLKIRKDISGLQAEVDFLTVELAS